MPHATVFLLMPFDRKLDWLHRTIVRAGEAVGAQVTRADDISQAGTVIDQVKAAIRDADAVVAVLSGQNANVFYEFGIAESTHRPIIVAESTRDLSFDVRHLRAELYGGQATRQHLDTLEKRVSDAIRETIRSRRQESSEAEGEAPGPEATKSPYRSWMPRQTYPPVGYDAQALVVRLAVGTSALSQARNAIIDDDARVELRASLERAPLQEWLAAQADAWRLPNIARWHPEGPANNSGAATLRWYASTSGGEPALECQAVLSLPTTSAPSLLSFLLDVVLAPRSLDQAVRRKFGREPGMAGGPYYRLSLPRLWSLLDALLLTAVKQGPSLFQGAIGYPVALTDPVIHVATSPETLDHYIDLTGGEQTPGTSPGSWALIEVAAGIDLLKENDRHLQIERGLERIFLDAGLSNAKSLAKSI